MVVFSPQPLPPEMKHVPFYYKYAARLAQELNLCQITMDCSDHPDAQQEIHVITIPKVHFKVASTCCGFMRARLLLMLQKPEWKIVYKGSVNQNEAAAEESEIAGDGEHSE